MARADGLGEPLLELLRARARREPAGVQDVDDRLLLALGDRRAREREERAGLASRHSSPRREPWPAGAGTSSARTRSAGLKAASASATAGTGPSTART